MACLPSSQQYPKGINCTTEPANQSPSRTHSGLRLSRRHPPGHPPPGHPPPGHPPPGHPPPGHGGSPKGGEDDEDWHPPQSLNSEQHHPPPLEGRPKHELKPRHPHVEQREKERQLSHTMFQRERANSNYLPRPTHDPTQKEFSPDYLHTYRTKHSLRLLYLDGESSAKSELGTLDLEDMVLLHYNPPPQDGGDRRGPPPPRTPGASGEQNPERARRMGEIWRTEKLCEMVVSKWQERINGFLRMEMGFEIILCSFEETLNMERITEAEDDIGPMDYYKAVAARFDGIGGDRVTVDYGKFVSLFNFDDAFYFDDGGRPRVNNDTAVLKPVRGAIDAMILQNDHHDKTNWQATTDMVIAR